MSKTMWRTKHWYEWLLVSIRWHGLDMVVLAILVMWPALARGDDFVDALNAARQNRGLTPIVFDAGLIATSSNNNAWQRVKGLGHWDTAGLSQVSAMACGDASGCLRSWTASGAHAALIYAPNLASCGFHSDGYYATATLSMGQVVTQQAPPVPIKPTPQQQTMQPAKPTEGCRPSTGCPSGQSFAGCGGHTCRTGCVVSVRQCGFHKRGCHLFKRRCAW